jgi:hypothetical protein
VGVGRAPHCRAGHGFCIGVVVERLWRSEKWNAQLGARLSSTRFVGLWAARRFLQPRGPRYELSKGGTRELSRVCRAFRGFLHGFHSAAERDRAGRQRGFLLRNPRKSDKLCEQPEPDEQRPKQNRTLIIAESAPDRRAPQGAIADDERTVLYAPQRRCRRRPGLQAARFLKSASARIPKPEEQPLSQTA